MSVEPKMKNILSAVLTSIWIKIINQRIKLDMSLFFLLIKKKIFPDAFISTFLSRVLCVYMKLKCKMKTLQRQIIHKPLVFWPT